MAPASWFSKTNEMQTMRRLSSVGQGNEQAHKAKREAEARIGRLPVQGRYHRLPRRLEDDYEMAEGQELGRGYNGAVVLATNRRTGLAHAIKSFSLVGIDDFKSEEFASEVGIFLSLDHPHVARLLAVYESETEISMVMECCEGGELLGRVKEKKTYTEDEAADATWQMLLAINYLHSEGLVHRDLKLQNFIYEQKDNNFLKMIDFGFSDFFQKSGVMTEQVGTILYMAPEVLRGHYFGGSCDMWSLGVIVFAMLAGHMPFVGKSDTDTARAILSGKPTMRANDWAKLSPHAQDFLQKLLVVKPSDRMTAQQAMQHPWIAMRNGAGSPQNPNTPESTTASSSSSLLLGDEDVAASFVNFARATRFEQACMQMMAWSLCMTERRLLRDTYLELDTSRSGSLNFRQLSRTLRKKYNMSRADRKAVLKAMALLDVDKDREVHYSDFLAAMMAHYLKVENRDVVEEAFRRFDTKALGYLTKEGLWNTLQGEVNRDELEEIFQEVDVAGNGRIDLDEFMTYLFTHVQARAASSPESGLSRAASWTPLKISSGISGLRNRFFSNGGA